MLRIDELDMPRISVLLPVYNASRYLERAVRSLFAQRFSDFEILALNDASTDDSLAILHRLNQVDARLKVIDAPKRGMSSQLNEALRMARSEFIARMDADDIALPSRFSKQIEALDARPEIGLLAGAYQLIDERDRPIATLTQPNDHDALVEIMLSGRNPICHPLVMFRKSVIEHVGGYDASMYPSDDLDLWLRMSEVTKLAALDDVLLKYRQHSESVSELLQEKQIETARRAAQDACRRRHVTKEFKMENGWRPGTNRASKQKYLLSIGWMAFNAGHRNTARSVAFQSIRNRPFDCTGWKLLACSILKSSPHRETIDVPTTRPSH